MGHWRELPLVSAKTLGRTVPELKPASAATAPVGSKRRCTSGGRCCGTAKLDRFPLPS